MAAEFPGLEEFTKLLSVMYQQSWLTGKVPIDWRLADVTPIYKKAQKEDAGKDRPVSLTGKTKEQITFSAITQQTGDQAEPAWL